MSEKIAVQLTESELAELVISAVEAFQYSDGPYLEIEHRALARKLGYNEERIARLWRKAAEQAQNDLAAMRTRMPVSARFDALRPKPKVIPFRRFASKEQSAAEPVKSTKATVADLIRREFGNAKRKPEEELEQPQEEEQPKEEAAQAKPKAEAREREVETSPKSALAQLYLPGVAGEVQDYFLSSVMQPSHIMSLGVGLMVPTVLVGGYVFGPSGPKGCALQQTVVIVGPTSSGKQGAMDITKECVFEAGEGARALLGPNRFKSGAALVRWVTEHRVSLCIQDEFGRLLAKFGNPKSNPCEVEINDRMREFWAIGPGGIYNSPHGASKLDDSEMIVDPRLSIFGFGVHQEFYEACQIEDISNGFLNRIIVLDEPVALYPKTDIGPSKVGYDLKLNLEKLYGIKTSRRLEWTPGAKEICDAEVHRVFTETDERRRKLWSRTPEKIVRAASTFAASRFATKVERSDMEIAQVIMRHSDEVFRTGIDAAQKNRRLDHASLKLEIIRRLKVDFRCYETDDNGKPIKDEIVYQASDFEIQRSFRHNSTHKKAVPDAVDDLLASGTLRRLTIKTGGRNKVVNRLMEE